MSAVTSAMLVAVVFTISVLALAVWGTTTTWRLERRLAATLYAVRCELEALKVAHVVDGHIDARVFGSLAAVFSSVPSLGGAWEHWHGSIVSVTTCPRRTCSASVHFDAASIVGPAPAPPRRSRGGSRPFPPSSWVSAR